jgi:hypothetical protein
LAERFEVVVAKAQDIFLAKAEFCPLAQIFAFTFNGRFDKLTRTNQNTLKRAIE